MKPKPKYIILDDIDRPYAPNVCRLMRTGKYTYIQPSTWASWARKLRLSGDDGIAMTDFGFEWIECRRSVTFVMVREPSAVYPNGSRRSWQGPEKLATRLL